LYCKSPTIIKSRFSGRFKPKYLIPFKLTKPDAEEIYRKWIAKRLFAPGDFKSREEIGKITGVYSPYWLFDCSADGSIEGEGTTVSHWTHGEYRYTQTKYYRVIRRGTIKYKRIPVDASKKMDNDLMHKIEPFDYNSLTDFSMQYMSGFMAERYDVESNEAASDMRERVQSYTEERLRETVGGYSSFSITDRNVNLFETDENYALLPVYILTNKYRDKTHIFIINGQTGKIAGEAPVSVPRLLLFAGLVFAVVWLIAVFGGAFIV
jgi:hypothetical protein